MLVVLLSGLGVCVFEGRGVLVVVSGEGRILAGGGLSRGVARFWGVGVLRVLVFGDLDGV